MKRLFCLILSIVFLSCTTFAVSTVSHSWYFKPAKDGKQPELIPEASGFISNYNTVTMGEKESNRIYLTFDAGYENGNVEKILNTLNEKKVPGAFFILPQLAKTNPDLIKQMKAEGHLVCNHTQRHKDMSKFYDFDSFADELISAEKLVKEFSGIDMDKYYRPPEGRFSEQNLEFADRLGYTTVFWSLAYADWDNNRQMNSGKALELLCNRTHNGCVVLLHPTSSTNAEILGDYIDIMRGRGYEFASIREFD